MLSILFFFFCIETLINSIFAEKRQEVLSFIIGVLLAFGYYFIGYGYLKHPILEIVTLSLFISLFITISGILKIYHSLKEKNENTILSCFLGILTVGWGIFLITRWPGNSASLIPSFLGCQFTAQGISYLGIFIKKIRKSK